MRPERASAMGSASMPSLPIRQEVHLEQLKRVPSTATLQRPKLALARHNHHVLAQPERQAAMARLQPRPIVLDSPLRSRTAASHAKSLPRIQTPARSSRGHLSQHQLPQRELDKLGIAILAHVAGGRDNAPISHPRPASQASLTHLMSAQYGYGNRRKVHPMRSMHFGPNEEDNYFVKGAAGTETIAEARARVMEDLEWLHRAVHRSTAA